MEQININNEPLIQKESVEKTKVDDPQLAADQALIDMLNRGLPYCELAKLSKEFS